MSRQPVRRTRRETRRGRYLPTQERAIVQSHWFDTATQQLTRELPRRSVFALLVALLSPLLPGSGREVQAGCKNVGRTCDKNKDCCDEARCKGGKKGKCRCKSGLSDCAGVKACKNLSTDLVHCGGNACPELFGLSGTVFCVAGACRTCPAGADHCLAPPATCEGRDDCFCLKRVEDGVSTCGNRPRCDEPCDADADCPSSTFFCASGGDSCCPGSAGQGRCAELCAA